MNEKIKSVVTTVKTKWTDASKMAKILVISIPIVVIAIIIVLCIILNNTGKNTAVLFSGLSNSEAGEIASAIQALDGAPDRQRQGRRHRPGGTGGFHQNADVGAGLPQVHHQLRHLGQRR